MYIILTRTCLFTRQLKVDDPKFKTALHQCTSHYNQAFKMFFKINRPLECLDILIKTITLDEDQMNSKYVFELLIILSNFNYYYHLGTTNAKSKIKFTISIVNTLRECVPILEMLSKSSTEEYSEIYSNDNDGLENTVQIGQYREGDENVKETILSLLEEKLQDILKCMIKQAMVKTSK